MSDDFIFNSTKRAPLERICQWSSSKDAVLMTTYQDDYIVKGNCFQIRRAFSIPGLTTVKYVFDFANVASTRIIFSLPPAFVATTGPVLVKTYLITNYTGGTAIPVAPLNRLVSNTNSSETVFRTGITSSDTPGADLREYVLGSGGTGVSGSRAGSVSGAMALITPGGTKLCFEVANQINDVNLFNLSFVWYEL